MMQLGERLILIGFPQRLYRVGFFFFLSSVWVWKDDVKTRSVNELYFYNLNENMQRRWYEARQPHPVSAECCFSKLKWLLFFFSSLRFHPNFILNSYISFWLVAIRINEATFWDLHPGSNQTSVPGCVFSRTCVPEGKRGKHKLWGGFERVPQ